MTIGVYDTHTLMGVVEKVQTLSSYWLDLCFPQTQLFDTEFIDFDMVDKGKRLAPFVSPMAQGKVMSAKGFSTRRFKPAYVKPKDIVDAARVIKRRPGEAYTGSLSREQRYNAVVADIIANHMEMQRNRQEWMAAQAILNGSVVVTGEDYPTQVVDFGRDGGLTKTLGAGSRWNESGVDPVADLESWALEVLDKSGAGVTRVTMGTSAFKAFYANPAVKEQLDTTYRGTAAEISGAPVAQYGGVYRGRLGNLEIWTYSDWYEDDASNKVQMLDSRDVVLTAGPGVQGVRCFGAIMDADNGFMPAEIFPKMWKQEDPSAIFLMTQSAPLMVPTRVNATCRVRVIA